MRTGIFCKSKPVTHYLSYRSIIKKRFGCPVLKIPVNAGFSCPNRDGTISSTGCSFCDNRSFSPVAETTDSIRCQIANAIARDRQKHNKFIVYLQPFSNTYGSQKQLGQIYEPIIAYPNVVGLAIGTRPDCFTEDTFNYLADVAKRTYLSVELGLQSANDETLRLHRRGHSANDFAQAVTELSKRNIETVAHIMIGLPPETRDHAINTARFIASLPVSGVKIHQAMVIRGTALEKMFDNSDFAPLALEEYADVLCEFIAHLRPNQHIHRIMADAKIENGLIAPLWSSEKIASVNFIQGIMEKRKLVQGKKFER